MHRRRPQRCDRPHKCVECGCAFLGKPKQLTCSPECKKIRDKTIIKLWKTVNAEYLKQERKANSAVLAARSTAWNLAHPDKVRAVKRASDQRRRAKNPEKRRAISRRWAAANPDLTIFHRKRARLRIRKAVVIFKRLAEVNPKVYDEIADVRDKGRAMLRALKIMGIEIAA